MKSLLITISICLAVIGCAAAPDIDKVAVSDSEINISKIRSHNIIFSSINVEGGGKTDLLMGSKIENSGFKEALTQTLVNNKIFTQKTEEHTLSVTILNCTEPLAGFVLTVDCEMRYLIKDKSGSATAFNIISNGSANSLDGFNQYHIIKRKANERAIKNSIINFLEKLNSSLGQKGNHT